jgi:capsid protein
MHYLDGLPKVQLVDAGYVRTPLFLTSISGIDYINQDTGNRVRHGVEIDDKGVHVAYWVQKYELASVMADFVRVECRMKKFPYSEKARMIYGDKYRVDSTRGVPIIAAVMETAAKIGRYMSASLSSAETRAKMAYYVKHGRASTGENPNLEEMMKATGYGYNNGLPTDSYGEAIARNVQATTNNMTFNMPVDSELAAIDSKQELHVNEFFSTNMDVVCACVGYSPEVIMSKFGGSYSGSRAAIKDTEHTVEVKRGQFSRQFNQFVYNYCLDVWVVTERLDIPGYLDALKKQDKLTLAALRSAEWKGDAMPHIDPKVEVEAWRAKMGAGTEHIPLCTPEQAQEALSGLDGISIMEQTADTLRKADELGIEKVELKGQVIEDFDDAKEDQKGKPGHKGDDKKTKSENKKS